MRTTHLLLLLLVAIPANLVQGATQENIHAVINSDGEVKYYSITPHITDPDSSTSALKEMVVLRYIDGSNKIPKAFEVIDLNNDVAGFYVTSASFEQSDPVELAIGQGFTARVVPYDSLPDHTDAVFKFTNQKGRTGGLWFPVNQSQGTSVISKIIPAEWSASKVIPAAWPTSKAIPLVKDAFIASLRESMLEQAILLACKSRVLPQNISVTASFAASVGFVVGGEGTISFEATWDSAELCSP